MLSKNAIGNLINRYKAVLKKCNLINIFGSLAVAGMMVAGTAVNVKADDISDYDQLQNFIKGSDSTKIVGNVTKNITATNNNAVGSMQQNLTLNLNEYKLDGQYDNDTKVIGITVASGKTLNIAGDNNSAMQNFTQALYNSGTLNSSGLTFSGNSAVDFGGAISNYDNSDDATITFGTGSTNEFTGNSANGSGGALSNYAESGNAKITFESGSNNTFSGNSADSGGAIDNGALSGYAKITFGSGSTNEFTGNSANGSGGALSNYAESGNPTITFEEDSKNTFSGNLSTTADGGAIWNDGNITFGSDSANTFKKNQAANCGAISNDGSITFGEKSTNTFGGDENDGNSASYSGAIGNWGKITFGLGSSNKFKGNTAEALGGAIGNWGEITFKSDSTNVSDNTFEENQAGNGGALFNSNGEIAFESNSVNTFKKNQAANGGAVVNNASVKINSSVADPVEASATVDFSGTTDFSDNYAKTEDSGDAYGGALVNIATITAEASASGTATASATATFSGTSFSGNYAKTEGNGNAYGGALVNMTTITADASASVTTTASATVTFAETTAFSGNYAQATDGGSAYGGAISNKDVLNFEGTTSFTNNYAKSAAEAEDASGGAINNGGSGSIVFKDNAEFNNNYAVSQGTAYSGAIENYNTIDFQNNAVFTGNYAQSTGTGKDASGGAISNCATNTAGGVITFSNNAEFSNNYVSTNGEAYGGAIENYYTINFQGDTAFTGNYAQSTGTGTAQGGAIYNGLGTNSIGTVSFTGTADFSKNYAEITADETKASGGAIANNASIDFQAKTAFTENYTYAAGENSDAAGGAISNGDGNITFSENADVEFSKNHAVSEKYNAYSGAIENYSTLEFNGDASFSQNYAESKSTGDASGGAISNCESNGKITFARKADFTDNYVTTQGKAYGGAIENYVSLEFKGDTAFTGNYAQSTGTGTAQGGAIYNGLGTNSIGTINFYGAATFSDNYVQVGDVKTPNDIYNAGTINIGKDADNTGDVTINSGYVGVSDTVNINTGSTLTINAESSSTGDNASWNNAGTLSINAATSLKDLTLTAGTLNIKANAAITALSTVSPVTGAERTENTISMDIEKSVSMNSINVTSGTALNIIGSGMEGVDYERVTANTVTIADNSELALTNGAMLNVENGTVKVGADSDLYVGKSTDTTSSLLLAKSLDLAEGAELIVDPQWSTEYPSLALVANIVSAEDAENINLSSGNILVGSNSGLILGTTDWTALEKKIEAFNFGSLNKDTAPVFIAFTKRLNVSGNSVVVIDGYKNDSSLKSAAVNASAGSVTIGKNTLVLAESKLLGSTATQALINAKSISVGSNSKLFLTDMTKTGTYYIVNASNTLDYTEGAWSGDNLYIDNKLLKATLSHSGNTIYITTEADIVSALPKLDPSLARAVNELISTDLDEDSANYATRFIVRAANRLDSDSAAATIEGASKIAFAGAVPQMNLDLAQRMNTALASRDFLSATPGAGVGAGDTANGFALWALPTYQYSRGHNFKSGNFRGGYDSNVGGLALGADYTLNNSLRFGIAVNGGGGRIESNGDFNDTKNDINYIGVNAYSSWKINNFSLFGQIGWLRTDNDLNQKTPTTMNMSDSKADTDSNVFTVGLRASYQFATEWLSLVPYIGLDYYHVHTSSFNVNNSGQDMFHNGSIESDFLQIPVGVNMKKSFSEAGGWNIKGSLDLAVIPSIGNPTASQDIRIQGLTTNAGVTHVITDRVTGRGIVGIEAKRGNLGLGLNYTFQGGSHTINHGVQGMINWKF